MAKVFFFFPFCALFSLKLLAGFNITAKLREENTRGLIDGKALRICFANLESIFYTSQFLTLFHSPLHLLCPPPYHSVHIKLENSPPIFVRLEVEREREKELQLNPGKISPLE